MQRYEDAGAESQRLGNDTGEQGDEYERAVKIEAFAAY